MSEEKKDPRSVPGTTYEAGCHCGYISLSVTLRPGLTEKPANQCNCSMCTRAGYLLTYPYYEDVVWHDGSREKCAVYRFNTKLKDQMFCPKCGASIGIDFRDVHNPKRYGISARTFNGIDLEKILIVKTDGMGGVEPAGDLSGKTYKEGQETERAA